MTARPRILYIDDDPALIRLVQRGFARHGMDVVAAHSTAEGEARLAERFDAICIDHYMPEESGIEFLGRHRDRPDLPPIVYVTGLNEGRLAVAALRAGAADYVIKEATDDFVPLLHKAVADAIERETLRRERERVEAEVRAERDRAEHLATQRKVLLQEVNHRVANSLQLIAALTQLQEAHVEDPGARGAIAEVRARVFAVAQVHRRLYTSEDVRVVALDEYIDGLVAELRRTLDASAITIEPHLRPVSVDPDQAVAVGVVVAELVTNAVKYAYPAGEPGIIRVRLEHADGEAVVSVEDDGVGADGAAVAPASTGLGTKIIAAMAQRVRGSIRRAAAERGTHVSLLFPVAA